MERRRFSGVMLLFIVLAVVLITQVVGNLGRSGDVSYSDMRAYFTAEKVKSFTATDTRLVAKLQDGSSVSCALHSFDTFYNDMNDLVVSQAEKGVITSYDYAAGNENGWLRTLLPYVLAAMAFILLMNLIARMGGLGGGAVNDKMARFGEARIQDIPSDGKKVTFKDVAGADEEKEELEEIVQFLRDPQRYTELGAHIPKGVLLVGPPGTGKTLLAKAVAGEADTAFLSISGSDFVEMYVGVGASRVRDLFEQAKKQAPAIVFIDEIDAVGRQRGSGLGGGHDEREQTLNQLLVEMDGFAANEGVVVLAATNRVDILDPALLRPGRFDRQVFVGLPDIKGREEILKIHAKGKPLAEDVDLGSVARATSGFTGADLENLLNEAALLTGRRGQRFITEEAIHQSVIKVIAGPEKHSRVVPEAERRLTAYHEAGHAVVMQALPDLDPVHQITIVPRGQAGGMTIYLPEEDRSYLSRRYMLDRVAGLLGGRAAEEVVMNTMTNGASQDIQEATGIARNMVAMYGMSDEIGMVALGSVRNQYLDGGYGLDCAQDTAAIMDREVKGILDKCYAAAVQVIRDNREDMDKVVAYLLEKETITGGEMVAILEGRDPSTVEEAYASTRKSEDGFRPSQPSVIEAPARHISMTSEKIEMPQDKGEETSAEEKPPAEPEAPADEPKGETKDAPSGEESK